MLSIVIPVYNENEVLDKFHQKLSELLVSKKIENEIIYVDDGSTDNSSELISEFVKNSDNIHLFRLNKNYGQSVALHVGIQKSQGERIVTIDADLQNDPSDIDQMIKIMDKDTSIDVVQGFRYKRKDGLLSVFLSSIANFFLRKIFGTNIKDSGCTLKIMKSSLAKKIDLKNGLHRFFPYLLLFNNAKLIQFKANHFKREFGKSKYGINKTFTVIIDIFWLYFYLKSKDKPIQFFGRFSLVCFFFGFVSFIYSIYIKYILGISFIKTPLLLVVVLFFLFGLFSLFFGILCQFILENKFKQSDINKYIESIIKKT